MGLITPLSLGKQQLPYNLVQGPLAGFSCSAFRELIWQYPAVGYCTTEMLSAKDLITRKVQRPRFVCKSALEGLTCYQLSGKDSTVLAEAVIYAENLGADLIDLNCGCPKNKIRSKGVGSRLLANTSLLGEIILAMRTATTLPLSAKIRVDGSSGDKFNQEVARTIESAGADFIIVHGRHWTDDYSVECYYDQIADIVQQVSIPVLANGDISDYASLKKMLEATGAAGAMIARASMGRPWLFEELLAHDQEQSYCPPSKKEIGQLLLRHIHSLAALEDEHSAVLQARRFGKYYGRSANVDSEFYSQWVTCSDFTRVNQLVSDYFTESK